MWYNLYNILRIAPDAYPLKYLMHHARYSVKFFFIDKQYFKSSIHLSRYYLSSKDFIIISFTLFDARILSLLCRSTPSKLDLPDCRLGQREKQNI